MQQEHIQTLILSVLAAAILTPLLGWLLSRAYPPKAKQDDLEDLALHRTRNQILEYAGVAFLIAGLSLPFVVQGTDRLPPTATNIALILACGSLFMVSGIAALAALFGDRNAESFLAYIEHRRRISRTGTRIIARVIVAASIVALLAVAYLSP